MSSKSFSLDWPSALQFGLSLLAAVLCFALSTVLGLVGLSGILQSGVGRFEQIPPLLLSAGMATIGLLLLPSAYFALAHLVNLDLPDFSRAKIINPLLLVLVWPIVLIIGHWISQISALAWLLLPPIHVIAIGIPVLGLVYLANNRLSPGSLQRKWGIFATGVILAPATILLVETLMLLGGVLGFTLLLNRQPGLSAELQALVEQINSAPLTPELLLHIVGPYLARPQVLFSLLVFGAILVPLVEEAIKPMGIWFLAHTEITAAEGFSLGVISGAGYALFESLALGSQEQAWAGLVFARLGTDLIHILSTGLVGCALALAWQKGRYLRLGTAYLTAVLIHGVWNGLTLLNLAGELAAEYNPTAYPAFLLRIGRLMPFSLIILALTGLSILLGFNLRMRRNAGEASQEITTKSNRM